MPGTVHVRTLHRAAEIAGGSGEEIPMRVFLQIVDILSGPHDVGPLAAALEQIAPS
jgi:hypothetical protein